MAAHAVVEREGDGNVAGAAELPFEDETHLEVLGCLLFDVEDVRMAVGAIEKLGVDRMGKDRRRDIEPLGLEEQFLVEVQRFLLFGEGKCGVEELVGLNPVDLVAVGRLRQVSRKVFEGPLVGSYFADMTLTAPGLVGDRECLGPVVAGAAEEAVPIIRLGDLGGIGLEFESKFKVTDPATVACPVAPM